MRVKRILAVSLMLSAAGFALTGCSDSRLTLANYDRIEDGMSLRQVETILGKGDKKGGGLSIGSLNASAYEVVWDAHERFIAITLVNDEVIAKVQSGLE